MSVHLDPQDVLIPDLSSDASQEDLNVGEKVAADLARDRFFKEILPRELEAYRFKDRVGVIYFAENEHSELFVDQRLYYFLNGKNLKPKDHTRSRAMEEGEDKCQAKQYFIPISPRQLAELNTDIETKKCPSSLNTCMGGVAEILNKHTDAYFPAGLRQFPSLAATYLDGMKKLNLKTVGEIKSTSKTVFRHQAKHALVEALVIFLVISELLSFAMSAFNYS